ncbi:DNA topoisomerase IB [Aquimarina agarivorans]|uniref:DNA topoisomerase IB n=1 Tax=Aquimarina agarivorans TaxID=980584 RepID=UPI000248E747|nr:DNA topoisomerase IB [Aquimarina agarivorans]
MEKFTAAFWKSLYSTPELVIDKLDLFYVSDKQLSIKRVKKGANFCYYNNSHLIKSKKTVDRITKLVIPPAWKNVLISEIENGHLQAVGRDAKNRKQYRYHPLWSKVRNQGKFYRMTEFGKDLPKIRAKVDRDLEQKKWTKTKVLALIIRLLEETHIRIGNDQYAKRNKTYGLSTLRNRHLELYNDKLKFNFVGKKGKKHAVTLKNKKLIKLVLKCEEIPGWELFQYYDANGAKHSIDSGLVNEYLQEITGNSFTAKDFRTWSATQLFFESLATFKVTDKKKKLHKNILEAYDKTAKELGNTRNVCKKYYVHPILPSLYEDGKLQKHVNKLNEESLSKKYMSPSEVIVLNILKDYQPKFSSTSF